jgi:uncharacterized protein involved in type VI secretion and phage assembly
MSNSAYNSMMRGAARESRAAMPWLIFESAIVAENEDPDRLGRIKVVIPSIDPDLMFDDWIVPAATHCLGAGFGFLAIPPKGAEVLISGVLGQKFNLVYTSAAYNEEMAAAAELGVDWPGIKVPKNLAWIATLMMKLVAQNMQVLVEQLFRLEAANVESVASQLHKTSGQNVQSIAAAENKLQGQTVVVNGTTITVTGSGDVTISTSANVAITAAGNMTLQGRTVNKVGPPI